MCLSLRHDPSSSPCVVVVESDAGIQCVAPCSCRERSYPLRLGLVQVAASRARILKIHGDTFVHATGADVRANTRIVLDALASPGMDWDFMLLENLPVPSPMWDHFHDVGACVGTLSMDVLPGRMQKVSWLDLPASFEKYLASMASDTRYNLLRRRRKLEAEAGGRMELLRTTRPDQVPLFIEQADRVSAQSWQAAALGMAGHSNETERIRLTRIAEAGWLRSYVLQCGGVPVAFVLGYQYGDAYYHDETAYDQSWAKWGPGTVLNLMLIEDLFGENRPAVLDFGFGDNEYKRVFGSRTGDACVAFISDARRARGRTIVERQMLLARLEQGVRAGLRVLRLDRLARKWIKRRRG